jgi:mono/diheme cytochrome c family protein
LLLAACAKRDTAQPGQSAAPVDSSVAARSLEPAIPEAVNRIFQRSCQACHGPDGHGILAVAPDLRKANSRSLEQWQRFLSNPQGGHPGADLSPPTWLKDDEIAVMADYLVNLTAQNPPLAAPNGQAQQTGKQVRRAR